MLKRITNIIFFILLMILINTCQTPKEPDTEPPKIEVVYPIDNQTIFEEINIIAEASDNDALEKILFSINGEIGEDRVKYSPPWELSLKTFEYQDSSSIEIIAIARDVSGNETISDLITATVDNSTHYPDSLKIISVDYDLEQMTITWSKSDDVDFKDYNLYYSIGTNDFSYSQIIYTNSTINDTSFTISLSSNTFYPIYENWFWIESVDSSGLSTLSKSKSNTIDIHPTSVNNITVFYQTEVINNETVKTLNISWLKSLDWDFKLYKIEYQSGFDSDEENWNLLKTITNINETTFQTTQFEPSTDSDIAHWFKITVEDMWGQTTSSPKFNDFDTDGPPPSSNIVSISYDTNSMTVSWEQIQEDPIEFNYYNLYHSITNDFSNAEIVYNTIMSCNSIDNEDDCESDDNCSWSNENICYNNSIYDTSWNYEYTLNDTNYFPGNENWFWIGIVDNIEAESIGNALSNEIKSPPNSIDITSISLDSTTKDITVSWEANNESDFLNYKLYKSEFEWSYDTKQLIHNVDQQYDNSFSTCISYESNSNDNCIYINPEYENWFWITTSNQWGQESNQGEGMIIPDIPLPEAVNVISVDYNISNMTVTWNQSNDNDFASYVLYKSDSFNGIYDSIYNITNRLQTSKSFSNFNPTIENWYKIKTTDDQLQSAYGSPKSNNIDEPPSAVTLETITFNSVNSEFVLNWDINEDADFKNYEIYESSNYDMTNANSISTIDNRQTLSLNRQVDPEMIANNEMLFYQVIVEDIWGQNSYSNIESGSNHEKFIFSRGSENYDFIFSIHYDEGNQQYTTSGIKNNDIWLFQISSSGSFLREETYEFGLSGVGESDKSMLYLDNSYFLTGWTQGNDNDMDAYIMEFDQNLISLNNPNLYCATFNCNDTNGNSICDNDENFIDSYENDEDDDRSVAIINSSDNNFVIVGSTNDDELNRFFIWATKTNNQGEEIWNTERSLPYSSTFNNSASSIIETNDGNYMVLANIDNGNYNTDIWINKLDDENGSLIINNESELSNCNETSGICYGGESIDEAYAIFPFNGNYIIAGTTRSKGNGGYDGWVIIVDNNGSYINDFTYGGMYDDKIYSITESDNGYLTFCGYTRSFNSQNEDIWIFQIDLNGDLIFNKTIGGYYADKGYGIKSTPDGGFIISGISQSIPGNYGNLEAVLIKTDPFGNTINLD